MRIDEARAMRKILEDEMGETSGGGDPLGAAGVIDDVTGGADKANVAAIVSLAAMLASEQIDGASDSVSDAAARGSILPSRSISTAGGSRTGDNSIESTWRQAVFRPAGAASGTGVGAGTSAGNGTGSTGNGNGNGNGNGSAAESTAASETASNIEARVESTCKSCVRSNVELAETEDPASALQMSSAGTILLS